MTACGVAKGSDLLMLMAVPLFGVSRRLSQDLAKDLAILAREIHDVAGDASEQSQMDSSGPASAMPAQEEVC